ncbi:MAG: hypothetical protein GWN53_17050 [Gammaproteobacteria bacterium]|nr:hypothetical protein [Gammaproteobacteria bacterium]
MLGIRILVGDEKQASEAMTVFLGILGYGAVLIFLAAVTAVQGTKP